MKFFLVEIAQLLGVVEKLSFFESAILRFFCFIPIKISQHLWIFQNFWCAYTIKIYGKYLKIQNSFTSLSSLARFPFSLPLSMSCRTSWNNLPNFWNVCKIWIKMADRSPLISSLALDSLARFPFAPPLSMSWRTSWNLIVEQSIKKS